MPEGPPSGWSALPRFTLFRLAVLFSALFCVAIVLVLAFIFWQTSVVETRRVDTYLTDDARSLAGQKADMLSAVVDSRVMPDLRHVAYAGLYDGEHHRLAGNFPQFPEDLALDGLPHRILAGTEGLESDTQVVRAVGRVLPDGHLLVIGRNIDALDNLRNIVRKALLLGVVPALLLVLGVGALVSQLTQRRLQRVHETAERIMRGNLKERLPVRGTGDDFDRLAQSVNRMLDEIARLMDDMKSVGDNIAHDVRTPLTRVRTSLERARDTVLSRQERQALIDRALAGLDQALRLTTALLRIGEIEGGRRRAAFAPVQLGEVAGEIGDLYEPIAEEKGLQLVIAVTDCPPVHGDRDLLCELLANLVDNAIKFSPAGGKVEIALGAAHGVAVLSVADHGPGIPADQREAVFQRFFRADASRGIEGHGLGLSLVDAIVKLHGFVLSIEDNHPGSVFRLICSG